MMLWTWLKMMLSLSKGQQTMNCHSLKVCMYHCSSLVTPMPSGDETPPTAIETEHDRREKQVFYLIHYASKSHDYISCHVS